MPSEKRGSNMPIIEIQQKASVDLSLEIYCHDFAFCTVLYLIFSNKTIMCMSLVSNLFIGPLLFLFAHKSSSPNTENQYDTEIHIQIPTHLSSLLFSFGLSCLADEHACCPELFRRKVKIKIIMIGII